ncbi:MAG: DUF2148 domain-containing protein [Halobacteriota archaeon]|jgi:hypothetical protein
MYTAGVAATKLGMFKGCSMVYGIPLKASGRNIYFAAAVEHKKRSRPPFLRVQSSVQGTER